MMKRIIKTFIFLLIPISLTGQLAPITSQYVLNLLSINPAYAGNRGALNIAAFYRRQWTGIPGAPETMTLAADAPFLDSKLGLGFIITNDKIGVTKETHFLTNYSYKISMGKGNLSLGLGAGLITTNTAWSDLIVLDPGDESYLSNSRVFVVPDFSFGVYYSNKNFFAGLSVPKLLGYKFNYNKNKYTISFNPGQHNYLFNTGYIFNLSQKVKLFPSTLITISPGEKLLFDLNAYVGLNDRIWAGASYRNNRSLGALFQFAINNQLRVAYTYDFDISNLGHYTNGSHEIMLRYEFHYKVDAISPLNF
ncbi:MAG: type IX secretion system membrane protein PorP/SprF [Bacteroidales bacterium]